MPSAEERDVYLGCRDGSTAGAVVRDSAELKLRSYLSARAAVFGPVSVVWRATNARA